MHHVMCRIALNAPFLPHDLLPSLSYPWPLHLDLPPIMAIVNCAKEAGNAVNDVYDSEPAKPCRLCRVG